MKCLIVLVVLAVAANASPVKEVDLCTDCKTLFGDVKTRLVNPATTAVIVTNVNKYVCNFLLIGKEQCKASMKMFIGTGLGFMATLIDPNMICSMLMYCQPTPPSPPHAPEFTAHLTETMDLAKRFMELSKKDKEVDLCVDCKSLFTDVKARLADPATITQLSATVNKFTCDLLPVVMGRATCQAVVNGAIASGLSILKDFIDPNMICAILMYCQPPPPPPQMYFHHDDAHFLGRFFELRSKKSLGEVDLCVDCKTLFNDVKARLINPATVSGIVGQFNKYVCNLLPLGKEMCTQMATQMVQTGMGLLSQLIDANMICTMLMYCQPTPPPATLYFKPTVSTPIGEVDLCADCTALFGDVKARLVNPATTAAITGMVEKFTCELLPMYKTECKMAVSTVVSMGSGFMANLIDAKVICKFLMYCTA